MTGKFDICLHCRHLKRKYMNDKLVSDYCNKGSSNVHCIIKCNSFSRSWKSRLGLVK